MMIDCDTCVVRDLACGDCVVTVLLGSAAPVLHDDLVPGIDLDGREQAAIAVLAGAGLVPPLRLVNPAEAAQGGPGRGSGEPSQGAAGTNKSTGQAAAGDGRTPRSA